MQYVETEPVMKLQFFVYMVGFFIPFNLTIFLNDFRSFCIVAYIIQTLTLIWFFCIEIVQIKFAKGIKYFTADKWNIFDFSMIFMFGYLLFLKINDSFDPDNSHSMGKIVLTLLVLINGFVKF